MSLHPWVFILTVAVTIAVPAESSAQTGSEPSLFGAAQELPLYPGVAPGSEKWDYPEITIQGKSGPQVKNVVRPTLLYFPRTTSHWHCGDRRARWRESHADDEL